MSSDADKQAKVERLKTEGNALHVKGDYAAARSKYTDAIKLDDRNAVLYANRAASYIALKQWAVKLDPNYGKAWARLARASSELRAWPLSINAWKRALETLPSTDLTPQQQELKAQYTAGLEQAQTGQKKLDESTMESSGLHVVPANGEMPWDRALRMEDELTAKNILNTSAWAIMNADRDFSEGVVYMKQLQKQGTALRGNLNALMSIVGGLLRDHRVFHMDSQDWLEKLQLQVEFELSAFEGWPVGGPETVKEEAVKRLKEKGWQATRGALGSTIRGWFIRAYLAQNSGESIELALQHYNNIMEVLEWGARTWHDVPSADRGYIFQKTFIRAIRMFRLQAYLQALKSSEDESKYSIEDLIDMANQMVDETTKHVPKDDSDEPVDKGAWFSFFVYPIAEARAILGAVFLQQGMSAKKAGDAEQAENMLAAAAKFYKKAAETYPPDDENAPFYLKIAWEAEAHRGRPLSETLELCERIHKLLPGMMKIWEFNPSSNLKTHMLQLEKFEQRAYVGLLEDRYTLDTPTVRLDLDVSLVQSYCYDLITYPSDS
ncbi:TPR-like protein [Trametes polyzona]|nr:TPR-like protein [Trametes polyzona]